MMRVLSVMICAVLSLPSLMAADGPVDPQRIRSTVDSGLRWLVNNQITEDDRAGAWESDDYHSATAAFAGLALLSTGHRPGEGAYGVATDRALRYVISTMDPEGYLGQGNQSGMYIHAVASLFALSCLGTLDDPERERELADWCRKAVAVIVGAQEVRKPSAARGGWRYTPFTGESDVSVTSWQLLVLHTARSCGYDIDDGVFDSAITYINRAFTPVEYAKDDQGEQVLDESGQPVVKRLAGYTYRPGITSSPEASVSGATVFIKSVVEGRIDSEARAALPLMRANPPSWGGEHYDGFFFFAAFYTTQGMFQLGGDEWAMYRNRLQHVIVDHQAGDGSWPFPEDNALQSKLAGRAYATAMAVLLLAQDRQFLPMYQRQVGLF